jgi:hypothetical protein
MHETRSGPGGARAPGDDIPAGEPTYAIEQMRIAHARAAARKGGGNKRVLEVEVTNLGSDVHKSGVSK